MKIARPLILSIAFLFLVNCTGNTQEVKVKTHQPVITTTEVVDSATNALFTNLLKQGKRLKFPDRPMGQRIVSYGMLFLDEPYVDKTLEIYPTSESVVCNLKEFDCVTFFENSWTFARVVKLYEKPSLANFTTELRTIRYRNGTLDGYPSRLHYTTDYFYNNAERGNLKEMTRSIGEKHAVLETKPINFMSTHPASYKQLQDNESNLKRIEFYEREIAARGGFYYIKKENVAKIEKGIEDGDLIGITTSIPGIDCSHTGIALRAEDGRIHLMHASLTHKKVVISDVPLADYLAGNAKQTGIIVYRPLEVEKK